MGESESTKNAEKYSNLTFCWRVYQSWLFEFQIQLTFVWKA